MSFSAEQIPNPDSISGLRATPMSTRGVFLKARCEVPLQSPPPRLKAEKNTFSLFSPVAGQTGKACPSFPDSGWMVLQTEHLRCALICLTGHFLKKSKSTKTIPSKRRFLCPVFKKKNRVIIKQQLPCKFQKTGDFLFITETFKKRRKA